MKRNERIVYMTAANKKEAEKISLILLKSRFIACANIFSISSLYWWKNRIEKNNECAIIMKTNKSAVKKIEKVVKKIHSYENPCLIVIPIIRGSTKFLNWINEEVR
ncbi:MAG: divalent-cation tolerance protein CutA [Candidatus Aenigmatarchaeota archaeon]